jgi:hypothetical protein
MHSIVPNCISRLVKPQGRTELSCSEFNLSACEGLYQNRLQARQTLQQISSEKCLSNPRSPQLQSITGHAEDHRAKGITMSITRSIRSPLFAFVLLAMSAAAYAQLSVSISFAPPELPVYEQPLCPGDGYLWTPGYWAYANSDYGYYWVPGTWVMAPEPGLLWTPAYWGWRGNGYFFNEGYWGTQVGFYGGVSYGYGYYGEGYEGGRWQSGRFYYNRSVNNVNVTNIHNVYNTTVIHNTTINRVSYNGGTGGISARPRPQDEAAGRERHIAPVAVQTQHEQTARMNPEQRASVNHGTPPVAATPKPSAFSDRDIVHAKPAAKPYSTPVNRAAVQPPANTPAAHPENNAVRSDRPTPNSQPESNRAPSRPNQPEPNRPPTAQPERQPEPNRPPTAQPNNRPEPNRNEPTERPLTPPPSDRSQPQHASPPAEPRAQQQQQQQQHRDKPEQKKSQEEKPKQNEKPQ